MGSRAQKRQLPESSPAMGRGDSVVGSKGSDILRADSGGGTDDDTGSIAGVDEDGSNRHFSDALRSRGAEDTFEEDPWERHRPDPAVEADAWATGNDSYVEDGGDADRWADRWADQRQHTGGDGNDAWYDDPYGGSENADQYNDDNLDDHDDRGWRSSPRRGLRIDEKYDRDMSMSWEEPTVRARQPRRKTTWDEIRRRAREGGN